MNLRREKPESPIEAIRDNLIFARGQAAAVYRVETSSFEFLSEAEKHALHGRLSMWMIKAETNFSIYRVCREYSVDAYVRDTVSMIDERYADRTRWEGMLSQHADRMREMRSFTPEVYFVVSLHSSSWVPWQRKSRDLKLVRDADQEAFDLLAAHIPARRATTRELQWLVRRAAVRGVCEPDIDPHWAPPALELEGGVWESGRADVQAFAPTLTEHRRSILAESEDGESLQAMLALGKLPKRLDYPGSAELLFAPLEKLDFPVDVVAHTRYVPNKKMLAIADNSIKDAHDEFEDAMSRFVDRKTKRRAQEVIDVQDYFASEPYPPGLETFISFAVSAPEGGEDLLSERIKRIKRAYGNVRLYRPFSLQADLFDEHMLKPDGAQSKDYRRDYRRLLIAEQYAAMMPIGANEGGSNSGYYIGYTYPGSPRPVKYDPYESLRLEQTGTVFMNGTLGSTKTVSAQFLTYVAEHSGAVVVDIDPKKPEPDHSLERWPRMEGRVDEILINNVEAHRGQLDPLVFALPDMKEELASEYLMDILPTVKEEWRTEIIDAVRAVLRGPTPCIWKVVERLLASDEEHARSAGKALKVWGDWGLCKLAFSRGAQGSSLTATKSVTMIKAPTLALPMAGTTRDNYDSSEKISVATFRLMIARSMRMLAGVDRNVLKILFIDEVHVFTSTPDGVRFLQMIVRMARFMGIIVILASQLPGDLGALEELIGVRFVFRQQTDKQARINLEALGLISPDKEKLDESEKALIKTLRTFPKGCCLMKGLDGRVVLMRFDPGHKILEVANTDPSRSAKVIDDLEHALAA